MQGTGFFRMSILISDRMLEIVRSMEKQVEARESELNSWRERYQSVKKSYEEQLGNPLQRLSDV